MKPTLSLDFELGGRTCKFPTFSLQLKDDKHVESYLIPCLDVGSKPAAFINTSTSIKEA